MNLPWISFAARPDSAAQRLSRLFALACLALLLQPGGANAKVVVVFHSFNGSVFGRYPHTFVELTGTLDAGGNPVHENYGYTAVHVTSALLSGNVRGTVASERDDYVQSTNVHFRVPITDRQYYDLRTEIEKWRNSPTPDYNLKHNNCVSFVAQIARMIGLKADVPASLVLRPKAWLNYVSQLNPQLHAAAIR